MDTFCQAVGGEDLKILVLTEAKISLPASRQADWEKDTFSIGSVDVFSLFFFYMLCFLISPNLSIK